MRHTCILIYGMIYEYSFEFVEKKLMKIKLRKNRNKLNILLTGKQAACSVTNRNQDHSDVVSAASPHRLAGQLLTGCFKPELLLCWSRVHEPRPLPHAALLQSQQW